MICEITYSTRCQATIVDCLGDHWTYGNEFKTLQEAIDWVTFVIDDGVGLIQPDAIKGAFICDCNTGELLAECRPDDVEDSNEDYGDWDYNEDMGFDPYMGCYSDDC